MQSLDTIKAHKLEYRDNEKTREKKKMTTRLMMIFVQLDIILSCYDAIASRKANATKYVKERYHCNIVKSGTWLWLSCRIMQLRFDVHDAMKGRKPGYHFNKPLNGK